MNNEQRYETIKKAVQTALDKGVRLINGDWGVTATPGNTYSFDAEYIDGQTGSCGCALSCLLAENKVKVTTSSDYQWTTDRATADAAQHLETTTDWVNCFILGFDGDTIDFHGGLKDASAYRLGALMREEFANQLTESDQLFDELVSDAMLFADAN